MLSRRIQFDETENSSVDGWNTCYFVVDVVSLQAKPIAELNINVSKKVQDCDEKYTNA